MSGFQERAGTRNEGCLPSSVWPRFLRERGEGGWGGGLPKGLLCSTLLQRGSNNHESVNMFVGRTLSAMNHTRMITSSR